MKQITVLCALLFGLALTTRAQAPGDALPGHYVVEVQLGASPLTVARNHGLAPSFVYQQVANGFAAQIPPGLLRQLARDPRVVSIVPDRVVAAIGKGDSKKPGGGGGGTTAEIVPEGVARIGAAGLGVTGAGVGVAIVDTGLDTDHPDLLVSSAFSFNAFAQGLGEDDNGHGTHVGGIVAALQNNSGVVGVAPGATLYAVKVLNGAGSGTDGTIIAGLEWIAANADAVTPSIRVVNLSLGRPGSIDDNTTLRGAFESLQAAGISVVVAAGNDCGSEVSGQVPACYPEVMAVSSTTALNGKANRSGFQILADTASYFTTDGAGVAVAAPGEAQENVNNGYLLSGVGILSTAVGGGTTRMSGTSMAAPHVAGVAALLYEADGLLAVEAVRTKIMTGAEHVGLAPLASPTSCYSDDQVREGILSAPGALAASPGQ